MKIGIDISQVVYKTGVSRYTENLLKNLLKVDDDNSYVLFGGVLRKISSLKRFISSLSGNFETRIYPIPPRFTDLLWNRLHILAIESLTGKIDVFHSSDWSQPPARAFKITTVHDLTPIKFIKETPKEIVSVHTKRLEWVKKEVDRVIAPSSATKQDLVELGFDKSKLRVIPEAPSENFKPQDEESISQLRKKFLIPGRYILGVGVSERKNTQRIINAFEKVRPGEGLTLVLVGRPEVKVEERRGVRLLGHVTDELLPTLYSGAEVLVYTSIYEGFGLPLLEAFACETPVVTSNISSMPEVAGDAAVLVDPYDVGSIAEGIKMALESKKELTKRGLKRVKEFSWEKTATATLKVYNEGR